jgi:cysteine-rich repeat protein
MRKRTPGSAFVCAAALVVVFLTASAGYAAAPALPGIVTVALPSPDTDIPIPDNGSIVSVLNFTGGGTVVDVDVTLDIAHTRAQDLDIFLVSPGGQTITLTSDNGVDFDNVFTGTTFDDQAPGTPSATNIRNFVFTDLTPTGPLQPEEALGAAVGEAAAGPWALVVVDDAGGSTGTLRSWSLTISTLGGVSPGLPMVFDGESNVNISDASGAESSATVSGVPSALFDVDVTVSISHDVPADLDVFLTSPSGRRIDLVTDVGGGNSDLFNGTTFDDQAGTPVGDAELPEGVQTLAAVVPEGALAAFMGENANGQWTLTVVDDTAGFNGEISSWSLAIRVATVCGDGSQDSNEACDDGNQVNGDGCDLNCTATACGNGVVSPGEDCDDGNTVGGDSCPSTCRNGELSCDDCVDNDGNGLVDAADPACEPTQVTLLKASVASARGKVKLVGAVSLPADVAGTMSVVLGDAGGATFCGPVADVARRGGSFVMRGALGLGSMTVKLSYKRGGTITVRGRGLDLAALDDPNIAFGLSVGTLRLAAGGLFRERGGGRWVYP